MRMSAKVKIYPCRRQRRKLARLVVDVLALLARTPGAVIPPFTLETLFTQLAQLLLSPHVQQRFDQAACELRSLLYLALLAFLTFVTQRDFQAFLVQPVMAVLPLLVQADFCPVLLLSLHHVQLPATVRLLTAVLWKACLDRCSAAGRSRVEAGRVAVFQAGGVDVLIEMLQNFPNDATVLRNCSGCLLLLTRDCGHGRGA